MKNAFTLVELLAVIALLGIIAVITVPIVQSSIKTSREKSYDQQISIINEAAERWVTDEAGNTSSTLERVNGFSVCKSIESLKDEGYLEADDIIDPRDGSTMDGGVDIVYDEEYSQYTYEYNEDGCS